MKPERGRLADLAEVIENDLGALRTLSARLNEWLPEDMAPPPDSPLSYSSAMVLHHIYNAIENLFRQTMRVFGESVPESEQWHRILLNQMLAATDDRPAVFTARLQPILEELLRFRHRVRHSYDYDLDPEKLSQLVSRWRSQSAEVLGEVEEFHAAILRQLAASLP